MAKLETYYVAGYRRVKYKRLLWIRVGEPWTIVNEHGGTISYDYVPPPGKPPELFCRYVDQPPAKSLRKINWQNKKYT